MPSRKKIIPAYSFLKSPTPQQIRQLIDLYRANGWWWENEDREDVIAGIVAGSFFFLAALHEDVILGMGRAISDGISDAYIQDVAVVKSFEGQGIGSAIVKKLIENLQKEKISWIGLIAERDSYGFYERLGLKVMPDARPMIVKSL